MKLIDDRALVRLFVATDTLASNRAIARLQRAVGADGPDSFGAVTDIEIIDVLQRPELGERYGIRSTPTLVRVRPGPEERMVGPLDDGDALTAFLSGAAAGPGRALPDTPSRRPRRALSG